MDGPGSEQSSLRRAYRAYLRHKNALAYGHVAVIIVGYAVGTRFEAAGRALMVPAIFSLILIVVETLARLDTTVDEGLKQLETGARGELTRVEATVGGGLRGLERTVTRFFQPEFAAGTDAENAIVKLVDASKAEVTTIDIIAATGGSNLPFLRRLRKRSLTRPIKLNLYLVDPDIPSPVPLPEHWEEEIEVTLKCLRKREFVAAPLDLTVYMYPPAPSIRAVLVDNQDLFLGFFRWAAPSADAEAIFTGAEGPHRLYRKGDPDASHYIGVVEDWLVHAPKWQVLSAPPHADPGPSRSDA